MFAYCLNNPICYADSSGYFPSCQFSRVNGSAECGYGYIINQDAEPYASVAMGKSTIGDMGCGIVATYNTLISLGAPETFIDVCNYYTSEPSRLMNEGKDGISIFAVAKYFFDHGYTVAICFSTNHIAKYSWTADACIMCYCYSSGDLFTEKLQLGAHYIEYSRHGYEYWGRNTSEFGGEYSFASPSSYGNKNRRFLPIVIFIFAPEI